MVSSTTIVENGKSSPPRKPCAAGIGAGNYRLVGWDMDTTGKKVIDEICQIAGYTPSSSYSQYVMPYKDLNPPAMKRHNMKVVTIGKFRVLKDNKTNKVLKSKSEVSALAEFLTWLESIRGDATDGIILVYHEPRKIIPAMLLESLKKYNLLERFKEIVKGFANGFNIAEVKCASTIHAFTLRTLSRTLLNQETQLDNARDRAYLALQIVQHLSSLEVTKGNEANGSGDSDSAMNKTVEFIREFIQPVEMEEQEYAELKVVFERQNSLKPIFEFFFRINRRERQHASPLRRLLAEAGIEYTQLQEAWSNGKKEGLENLIKEKLTTIEEKKVEDLLFVLESHFDPDKKPQLRISGDRTEIKTQNSKIIDDKENNNNKCDSSTESPDTTTSSSPPKIKSEPSENSTIIAEE
ncbi:Maternal protein exuperantia [Habropoda laboriosa]|uniref:Maternal protein exuperantia n=1 Tax=Habropoda laboriosa TaxID=597456 RepID=A0A0L7QRE5_9HYME|nr:PREDICTED: maternal protein exuperantia [Habropoda laboriosa]XP_017794676.1 PREDICTED: maternal protein exuperantia [Habropoda laboriosa]XP_017794677.1 PREDICTED: maternal protein exuperantia [Habropoda laboriosa]XP_017794678.1 PREDICTED: maternal protein exuperantia [Habropoda laboriosa]XP_017794679.1 PREDICTED: maternal protein exuperantia [Habropoda laboriosa]KOC61071.1 Maternal protein exuperantia [Habropoda laboriosa]